MSGKKLISFLAISTLFGLFATAPSAFAASKEKVLYSFKSDGKDGWYPDGLVFDDAGNLYGTTSEGGNYGYGAVFELTPGAGDAWTETLLYNFCSGGWPCSDGAYPALGSVIVDADGKLYGTTSEGGAYGTTCLGAGCGTVFALSPNGDGTWSETVLHNFNDDGKDGWQPTAGLTFDATGNLYGTTSFGGSSKVGACRNIGCGTVFELTPSTNGTWTEKVLYSFCSLHACADGRGAGGNVILDGKGNLYGATGLGGSHNCGTEGCGVVFQLRPAARGKWKENVLHTFLGRKGKDGSNPGSVILDAAGNLYGATSGSVFELVKTNFWAEKVLHKFGQAKFSDTAGAPLIFDASGNLYSTTVKGGANASGTVFRLAPQVNGRWMEEILHSFRNDGQDGYLPTTGVIFDTAGNIYGTTSAGGSSGSGCDGNGCGTVFEIAP
jgi:uncharacterized repeat protein (TIGR03803 family)